MIPLLKTEMESIIQRHIYSLYLHAERKKKKKTENLDIKTAYDKQNK
jgi:hypothetical protein